MLMRAFFILLTLFGLSGCGMAWHQKFYKAVPESDNAVSADWGTGTVIVSGPVCTWIVEGDTTDSWPIASTLAGVVPVIPLEVGKHERSKTELFDIFVTLLSRPGVDSLTYDPRYTCLTTSSGESVCPRLLQVSRFAGGVRQIDHQKIIRIADITAPIDLWEVTRVHMLFVMPSEDMYPARLAIRGVVSHGTPLPAVTFNLEAASSTNIVMPGVFFKSPRRGEWPSTLCNKLLTETDPSR